MHKAAIPTLEAPRKLSWAHASDPSLLIGKPRPLAPGEALTDAHHEQAAFVAPIFARHFVRLAQVVRDCGGSPSSYITAQLSHDRAPRIRIEHAEASEPFTAVLKDPGCSMLHCGVYVWLTVTHGSLNVTRPDARPSSCVHLLASSPDHILARSRTGIELLMVPAQQAALWNGTAADVWAALTSSANTL